MEILFLLISLALTLGTIYLAGRSVYSHDELVRLYEESFYLGPFHVIVSLAIIFYIFITLCAINNTYWNLPYLFHP